MRVRVIGHRGAAALAPDNSLAAIRSAATAGADAVELDVRRNAAGHVVLAHDDGDLEAPTLDAALALARDLGLAVQLDVKEGGLEHDVVAALARHGLHEGCFVSSPSIPVLRAFAAADARVARAYTYPEDRLGATRRALTRPFVRPVLAVLRAILPYRLPRRLRAAGASIATLNAGVVSPRVVAACRRAGAEVYAWTVDDAAEARALVEAGTVAIITDDPRIFVGGIRRA